MSSCHLLVFLAACAFAGAATPAAAQGPLAPPPPFLPATPPAPLVGPLAGFDAPVAPSPERPAMLASLSEEVSQDIDRRMDAAIAGWILASGSRGLFEDADPRQRSKATTGRPQLGLGPYLPRQPLNAKAKAVSPSGGFNWSALTSRNLGDASALAMALSQSLDGVSSYNTRLQVRHASGPVDVNVAMTGTKALGSTGPMGLAYNGSATVNVAPQFALGFKAQGDLGSMRDLALSSDQTGTALAKFRIKGNRTEISAETSYNFPLTSASDTAARHMQMSLNFNWKM